MLNLKAPSELAQVRKIKDMCMKAKLEIRIVCAPEKNNESHSEILDLSQNNQELLDALVADNVFEIRLNSSIK